MKRLSIDELAYPADTAALFEAVADRPWAAFLDSGGRGRYDILVADPVATVTTRGPVTTVTENGCVHESRDNPLVVLRELWRARAVPPAVDLPYTGGILGYFGYDLARRLERLPQHAVDEESLPEMAVGIYDAAVIVDHQERRAWVVSRGDRPAIPAWSRLLGRTAARSAQPLRLTDEIRSNMGRAGYAERFERIQQYLREGDCYQVNLAQRFAGAAEGDPWQAYKALRRISPAPFAAYLNTPDGYVLSNSPERFLQVKDGAVETRPIKGTRRRSLFPEEDRALAESLKGSPKDRAENLMIVDLLRNDLGKTCAVGSVHTDELFALESYATVHHLVSTIRGRLAVGRTSVDLLAGCFPGGSVTGAPKLRAMEIIEELEPHRRGVYCGAIGYIDDQGSMDTNIAIRTLVYSGHTLRFWAGGGIVIDSRMEDEYQETIDKAAAMLRLLEKVEMSHVGH